MDHLGIWCQIYRNMKTVYGSKEGSAQSAFCNSILWMTESVFRKEELWRFWIAHGLKHITSSLKQWSQCDACACLASIGTGWRVYSWYDRSENMSATFCSDSGVRKVSRVTRVTYQVKAPTAGGITPALRAFIILTHKPPLHIFLL